MATDRVPVWLDCDPGHDDAAAIILAANSPRLELIGVSSVSGNVCVDKTTKNAAKVLALCGEPHRSMEVLRGADEPLVVAAKHDPEIHGESGLEGSKELDEFTKDLQYSTTPCLLATLSKMAEAIKACPNKVDVVATGALTNIALLFRTAPEVLDNVRQIVLMGGAMGIGNRHPVAEFNIVCDPEAAVVVFNLPVKVVMVPLEVTHTVLVTDDVVSSIRTELGHSVFAKVVIDLMNFFRETYDKVFGFSSPPLHDPCAVAYCIDPSIFDAVEMRVDVVTGEHLTTGQTVCDIWDYTKRPKNVHVCKSINVDSFWKMMLASLSACNAVTAINPAAPKA